MRKLSVILSAVAVFGLSISTAFAGTIRVESDKNYAVKLNCSGNKKTINIRTGTTTVTFDSTSTSCKIAGGDVKWPVKKLINNGKWKIHNGVAKKN